MSKQYAPVRRKVVLTPKLRIGIEGHEALVWKLCLEKRSLAEQNLGLEDWAEGVLQAVFDRALREFTAEAEKNREAIEREKALAILEKEKALREQADRAREWLRQHAPQKAAPDFSDEDMDYGRTVPEQ